MSTRRTADIVFCVDASASMAPTFLLLQQHLNRFVDGLTGGANSTWNIRLGLNAYRASGTRDGENATFSFDFLTPGGVEVLKRLYAPGSPNHSGGQVRTDDFFTSDVAAFKRRLMEIRCCADEASLVALDVALDFPWRADGACHRVVVILTDEPLEQGVFVPSQLGAIDALIEKLHALHVKLFLVGPASPAFDRLSAADGCEYEAVGANGGGLADVGFGKLLEAMGKSVSKASGLVRAGAIRRGVFGQADWTTGTLDVSGA